ncbi:amidohydrolase family protein [Ruegeria profundi]|uniref:amidohydrolase family protein n=1 Tax=Ruegeria profundi TaxID=1685378 RepID=UPI001969EB36|nr:amidohydrolase family protein [Ruegeria profundi]
MTSVTCAALLTTAAVAQEEAPARTLFTNVNIYDGVTPKLVMDAHVLVEGNLIAEVSTDPIDAAGATVIDGGGRTLTPGLSDMHVHLQLVTAAPSLEFMRAQEVHLRMVPIAEDMLMRGFTTVRDACGNTHGLRETINDGTLIGPRIISSGACIGGWSSHADFMADTSVKGQTNVEAIGFSSIADGPDEIREAIRREMRQGASFIKLMIGGGIASTYDPLDVTTMSLEEIEAAVDETERWGTYATAHINTDASVGLALDAGMRTFEHLLLTSPEMMARVKEEVEIYSIQTAVVDGLGSNPVFVTPAAVAKAQFVEANASKAFEAAKALDIPMSFGVDSYGSLEAFRFNSQAITVRKNLFSNDVILEMMFQNNRKLMEMSGARLPYRDGPLAIIEPGAYADILLVDGDPTEDVAVFSDWENNIDLVMKDGVIYRAELAE